MQTRALIAVSSVFVNYWWAIFSLPPLLVVALVLIQMFYMPLDLFIGKLLQRFGF